MRPVQDDRVPGRGQADLSGTYLLLQRVLFAIFVLGGLITFAYWAIAMAILRPGRDRAVETSAGTASG